MGDGISFWGILTRRNSVYLKSSRLLHRLPDGERPVQPGPGLRAWAGKRLARAPGWSREERALAQALLWGQRQGLSPEVTNRFRRAGLSHVLAISGLHFGVLLIVAAVGGRLLPGVRAFAFARHAVSLLGGLWLLWILPTPAPWRAGSSGGYRLISQGMARRTPMMQSLWIAAALLTLLRPQWVLSAGFMLSFSATAAILLLAPTLARVFSGLGLAGRTLAVSFAAYVGVSPGAAFVFSELTPVSIVSTPLALPALVLAGLASLLTVGIPAAGAWTVYGIKALSGTVSLCAAWLPPPMSVSPPGTVMLLVFLLIFRCLTPGVRVAVSRTARILLTLILLRLHAGPVPSPAMDEELRVLDVGQGQAVLLRSGLHALLIDGGGSLRSGSDLGIREIVPALLLQGVRRLEAFAISHGDDDHAGGAISILERLDVGELWLPPGSAQDPRLRRIRDYAVADGIAVRQIASGESGKIGRMRWQALHPDYEDLWRPDNEKSLVLRVSNRLGSVMIPGELEGGGEQSLLRRDSSLQTTILILGHHGAARGSGELWLAAVQPELAIVSCGDRNRFHHPSAKVRSRLRERSIPLRRTDREGTIAVDFSGQLIK